MTASAHSRAARGRPTKPGGVMLARAWGEGLLADIASQPDVAAET
jgi:hypothetical protein